MLLLLLNGAPCLSPGSQGLLSNALFIQEVAYARNECPEPHDGLSTHRLVLVGTQEVSVIFEQDLDAPAHGQGALDDLVRPIEF